MADDGRGRAVQADGLEVPAEAVARVLARRQAQRRLEQIDGRRLHQRAAADGLGEAHEIRRRRDEHAATGVAGVVQRPHLVGPVARVAGVAWKVRGGAAGRARLDIGIDAGVVHAERLEDLRRHEAIERLARGGLDRRADHDPPVA